MLSEETSKQSSGEGDSIKVFVRVRPPSNVEGEVDHGSCLDVDVPRNAIILKSKPEHKVFTFDQVADIYTTQETVFSTVGKKIIDACVSGYNGTIFAYGQTGSGKTFTMLGPSEDADNFQHQLRGIIPRSFEYLFNMITRQKELQGDKVDFLCRCSFLEIYQEQIYDLLDSAAAGLHLRENIKKGVFVDGLVEQTVSSASDAYQVLTAGWLNRTVASTSMNRESSRSHAVFTVTVESKEMKNGVWNMRTSQLNLVDLAGSERQKDTNAIGIRLKEAGNINKSLSALGNVIMALVDIAHGKTRHVPYRDSKLTFLLRDSLGGNAKTYMIACAHPGNKSFGETLSTLQFARRAKMIKNKAVVNENASGSVEHLQGEIKRLKEALLQYQQGDIPPQIDNNIAVNVAISDDDDTTDAQWKRRFLEAMCFYEKECQEKKEIGAKNHKLQQLYNVNMKGLQQKALIIKFREETIKKLDKALKEKLELKQDDKDITIENLEKTIKMMQDTSKIETRNVEMQCEKLRKELKHQQSKEIETASNAVLANTHKLHQLNTLYKDLIAEKEKGDPRATPVHTPSANSELSVATIERHKSQISKYQAEIETLKGERQEETNKLHKEILDKDAEIVALKKGKDELENLLKSRNIRSQIERETTDHMHMETIKIMTTPKKAKYNLRNRTVLGSLESPMFGEEGEGDNEENLFSMTIPQELSEERVDALTEEIKKLQEENRSVKSQMEEQEQNIIVAVETSSRLEEQKKQLEELLTKQKSSSNELSKMMENLNSVNASLQGKYDLLDSEAQDLRIYSTTSEKKMNELKKERDSLIKQFQNDISQLETKLVNIEISKSAVEKSLAEEIIAKDNLQDQVENLSAQVGFAEQQLVERDELLKDMSQKNKGLQSKIEDVQSRYEEEKGKNEHLLSQLKETGDKNQELAVAISNLAGLESELRDVKVELDLRHKQIEAYTIEVQHSKEKCDQKEKELTDQKETITTLMNNLSQHKMELKEKEHEINSFTSQLNERRIQEEHFHKTIGILNGDLETLKSENKNLHEENLKQQADIDIKADDIEEYIEIHNRLALEKEELKKDLEKLQEEKQIEAKQLMENIAKLKDQIEEQSVSHKAELSSWESRYHSLEESGQRERDEVIDQLRTELAQKTDQADMFKKHAEQLKHMDMENEERIMQKNTIIDDLKKKAEEFDSMKKEIELLKYQNDMLENDMETQEKMRSETISELQDEMACIQEQASEAAGLAQDKIKQLTQENAKLEQDLLETKEVQITHQVEIIEWTEQINRYKAVAQRDHKEKDEMNSEIQELKETIHNMTKEHSDLHALTEKLKNENIQLASHTNTKQKIKYIEGVKNDYEKRLQDSDKRFKEMEKRYHEAERKYQEVQKENIAKIRTMYTQQQQQNHVGEKLHSESATPVKMEPIQL